MKIKVTSKQSLLSNANARMCISVGNEIFERESLTLLVNWLCSKFSQVTIVLADVLQRHNKPELGSDFFSALGDEWLKRNSPILDIHRNQIKVLRWGQVIADSRFIGYLEAARALYSSAEYFKDQVDQDAKRYVNAVKRRSAVLVNPQPDAVLNYIMEELAVIATLVDQNDSVEVYPGSQLKSTKLFKNYKTDSPLMVLERLKFISLLTDKLRSPVPSFESKCKLQVR